MASKKRSITSYIGAAINTYGMIQSITVTKSGDIEEAKNESGNVQEYEVYNKVNEYQMELIPAAGSTAIAVGDTLATSDSLSIVVTSVADSESNTGYPTLSVSGKHYLSVGTPSA